MNRRDFIQRSAVFTVGTAVFNRLSQRITAKQLEKQEIVRVHLLHGLKLNGRVYGYRELDKKGYAPVNWNSLDMRLISMDYTGDTLPGDMIIKNQFITNTAELKFPDPLEDWGVIDYAMITAENMTGAFVELTMPQYVKKRDTCRFCPESLMVEKGIMNVAV